MALFVPETRIFLIKAPLGVRTETLAPDLSKNEMGLGVFGPECPRARIDTISSDTSNISCTLDFDMLLLAFIFGLCCDGESKD